jgi:preprotein translocase subunit SecG
MEFLIWILHMLIAAAIVGLVLLQHGKGADMGAAFGSGASGSLFGASGSANFLSRTTAILAAVFFLTSLGLTYFSGKKHEVVLQPVEVPVQPVAPAAAPPAPTGAPGGAASKAGEIPK